MSQTEENNLGICVCRCNYYFWLSIFASISSFIIFPLIQFIYGIDLKNNTYTGYSPMEISDWLLIDGLISILSGVMVMFILKNNNNIPNIVKILFNIFILFIFTWTITGTIMLFSRIPLVIHVLSLIYNYIMLTLYVGYFIVSIIYYEEPIKQEHQPIDV